MSGQKFSIKRYEKDKQKCYKMSKSGINLDQLIKIEDSHLERLRGTADIEKLAEEADECGKKSALDLCILPVKDRNMDRCKYCDINI